MNNFLPVLLLHQVAASIFSRPCKSSIVEAIVLAYLLTGGQLVNHGQRLLVAGCFSGDGEDYVWTIDPGNGVIPDTSSEWVKRNRHVTESNLLQTESSFILRTVMFKALVST